MGQAQGHMQGRLTLGSVSRETASVRFPFLAGHYRGRRKALKELTHFAPDFVFWIFPTGELFDAKNAHRDNYPHGYRHILDDEPDYGGFIRGRVATSIDGYQLIAVYCRSEALADAGEKLNQFVTGIQQAPIPISRDALVVSDNADIYGTLDDLIARAGSSR
ncbi:MAG: hypothetical protein R3F20_13900 [Planctomycetota bacterium]